MTGITVRLFFGIFVALVDYYYSARKRQQTMGPEYNKQILQAIDLILDQQSGNCEQTREYFAAVALVKHYLSDKGLLKADTGYINRIKLALSQASSSEIVNNLSLLALFVLALCIEIAYDLLLGMHIAPAEDSGVISTLISDIYQIPVLFAGLLLGRVLKDLWIFTINSGEQQRIDDTINDCLHNTALLDAILETNQKIDSSSKNLKSSLSAHKVKLSRSGKKVYRNLEQIAEHITESAKAVSESAKEMADDISNYQQQREEKQQQEKDTRSKRFEDITKGR